MLRFKDLAIKYKILSGYLLILSFFLLLGLYFNYANRQISQLSRYIETNTFTEIQLVTELEEILSRLNYISHTSEHTQDSNVLLRQARDVRIYTSKFNVVLSEFMESAARDPQCVKRGIEISKLFADYAPLLSQKIDERTRGGIFSNQEEDIAYFGLRLILPEQRDISIAELSVQLANIDSQTRSMRFNFFRVLAGAFIICVLVSCWIARVIVRPIKNLVLAQRKLGSGSLDYTIKIDNNDEIGMLQKGFLDMAERLKEANVHLYRQKDELEKAVKERTCDLEQAKVYLEEITNGIEEGIMLLDMDFKILWANKKMNSLSGLSQEDIMGNLCYKVSHKRDTPCNGSNDICPVIDVLKTGEPASALHTHYDNTGKAYYVEVKVYPLKDRNGQTKQFVHVSRDVTQKTILEEQLKKSLQAMQEKVVELEKFHKLTVDRELKMIELKEKIEEMESKLKLERDNGTIIGS